MHFHIWYCSESKPERDTYPTSLWCDSDQPVPMCFEWLDLNQRTQNVSEAFLMQSAEGLMGPTTQNAWKLGGMYAAISRRLGRCAVKVMGCVEDGSSVYGALGMAENEILVHLV
jgi:hypothetical protein